MSQLKEFEKAAEVIGKRIISYINERNTILIIGHLDADGITSASVMGKAIQRKKGNYIIRIYNEINHEILMEIKKGEYDFHIFCELGAGLATEIEDILKDKWIILDHHQIPSKEKKMKQVFNIWQFNYDGSKEISAAGMAYFVAKKIDKNNTDISWLPVVAMIADRQDEGERRSVLSLNRIILDDAVKAGLVKVRRDILFYGRETKPVYMALASMTTPFIPGLSGNRDACLATLASTGLEMKQNGRWRTLADLDENEKKKVIESIIPYLTQVDTANEVVDSLIGDVYTLEKEDEHSSLRDVREFGTLLNACGRMKQAGIGVSICLGDRGESLIKSEQILKEYRKVLSRLIQMVLEDDDRIVEKHTFNMVIGDGIVDEEMLGSLASVLGGVARFEMKILLVRTTTGDHCKFSLRRPPQTDASINLGLIVKELADQYSGNGGGHEAAAGCKIPTSKLKVFLRTLNRRLQNNNENNG
jgi:RecJ-like exonuclease|tara:strand:- start:18 stop:1439 length:1422 start_codon:yes stop_codon:yes gene_type:complete